MDDAVGNEILPEFLKATHKRFAAHNPKHDETAEGVERSETLGRGASGRVWLPDRLYGNLNLLRLRGSFNRHGTFSSLLGPLAG